MPKFTGSSVLDKFSMVTDEFQSLNVSHRPWTSTLSLNLSNPLLCVSLGHSPLPKVPSLFLSSNIKPHSNTTNPILLSRNSHLTSKIQGNLTISNSRIDLSSVPSQNLSIIIHPCYQTINQREYLTSSPHDYNKPAS